MLTQQIQSLVYGAGSTKADRFIFWEIIVIGTLLPWIVGIGVKLYLDAHGKPTIPWSYFLTIGSIIVLIPVSVWWGLSYIILASVATRLLSKPFWGLDSRMARLIFFLGGFLAGCAGLVVGFTDVFREFDPLFMIVPMWYVSFPHMIGGLLLGFILGRVVQKRTPPQSNHG
jgi:hypothetical protein